MQDVKRKNRNSSIVKIKARLSGIYKMHILLRNASNNTYNIDDSSNMLTFVKKKEQNRRFDSERG